MKKSLPYIILGIGIAIFVGCYFFFKKRILTDEQVPTGI